MKWNCNVVQDLVPLYIEEVCCQESRAMVEEHLEECAACREKLKKMKAKGFEVQDTKPQMEMARFAGKVKHHRIKMAAAAMAAALLASLVIALFVLTLRNMYLEANPTVFPVDDGVYNLTADDVTATAEAMEEYALFTNYKQIQVTVEQEGAFRGTVMLFDVEYPEKAIQYAEVSNTEPCCLFTGLTSARRYRVVGENLGDAALTVGEGRRVSFGSSFINVLEEIAIMLF